MNELSTIVEKSAFRMKVWYRTFIHLQKHGPYIRHNLTSSHICLHCNNTYTGKYCPVCGQKYDVQRFTWSYVYQNIFTGLFNLGEGFLRTLVDLLYRPGYMIRDYLEGHRKPYFKPFQLLFVLGAIFLIYMQLAMPDEMDRIKEFTAYDFNTDMVAESVNATPMDEEQKNMIDHLTADYNKVVQFISKIKVPPTVSKVFNMTKDWITGNLAATVLMMLPFWFFAARRTFRKTELGKQMNGPEQLVSIVYIGCQFILLTFIIVFYFQIFHTITILAWFLIFIYWTIDHYQLYQISFLRALKLTFFLSLRIQLYLFIFAIIMGTITMQLALMFAD